MNLPALQQPDDPLALRERLNSGVDRSPSPVLEKKESGKLVETHSRSLLKSISWRATGTLDTVFISFLVTGKIKLALSIGGVELFTKILLFYLHERIWNKISFGRTRAREDYEI
jgi:uncharacterized membrane protein